MPRSRPLPDVKFSGQERGDRPEFRHAIGLHHANLRHDGQRAIHDRFGNRRAAIQQEFETRQVVLPRIGSSISIWIIVGTSSAPVTRSRAMISATGLGWNAGSITCVAPAMARSIRKTVVGEVEHRRRVQAHHRTHVAIGGVEGEAVGVQRAVGQHDSLRESGGPAGVEDTGQILAAAHDLLDGIRARNEVFVSQQAVGWRSVATIDDVLQARGLRAQLRQQRCELIVDEQDPRLAVGERIGDLARAPSHVARVHHRARPIRGVEILEVAVGIQRQDADAFAWSHSQSSQRTCKARHPVSQRRVIVSALATDRRKLARVYACGSLQGKCQVHDVVTIKVRVDAPPC